MILNVLFANALCHVKAVSNFATPSSLNGGHYKSMLRTESGKCKLYEDDFVTEYTERIGLNALKTNKHGVVYGLVYMRS